MLTILSICDNGTNKVSVEPNESGGVVIREGASSLTLDSHVWEAMKDLAIGQVCREEQVDGAG